MKYTSKEFVERALDAGDDIMRVADIRAKQFNSQPHEHDGALATLLAAVVNEASLHLHDKSDGGRERFFAIFNQELSAFKEKTS